MGLIPDNRHEDCLMYAFRYALGRRSYAVGVMVDTIIYAWDDLPPDIKAIIKHETVDAIKRDDAGMPMDVRQWERVLAL